MRAPGGFVIGPRQRECYSRLCAGSRSLCLILANFRDRKSCPATDSPRIASCKAMAPTDLRGKTTALPGYPTCHTQDEEYTYGLGIVISGNWLLQNPLVASEAGAEAYCHRRRLLSP